MRKTSTVLAGLLLLLCAPISAHAGGAVLELNQDFYLPGDTVRAHNTVWLKSSMGRLEDGPYFAYLERPDHRQGSPLPADAMRVAPVEITPWKSGEHGDVTVEFTLPAGLDTGRYWLTLCNDPCKVTLGDLVSTELLVAEDEDAGRFALLREELNARVAGMQYQLRHRILGRYGETLRARLLSLEADVTLLKAEVDRLSKAAERPVEEAGDDESSSALPSLLAFVVPAALAGLVLGRRSRND